MNGSGRSSSYSRAFLALGSVVVGAGLFRLARAGFAARGVLARIPDPARRAGLDARLFFALALALVVVVIAVAAGAIRRRPWARIAAIALLAAGAATGLGVAVLQVSALARGADRTPEAAEIGYGALLSYWRIAAVAVGVLAAAFCAAGLRRLASEDMKRQFEGGSGTPTG